MNLISGSCLCGQVTFECKNNFDSFHFCHCLQCQKATSSAHAANLFTTASNITWQSGQSLIKRYDVPNRAISKAFCIECGSGVPYHSKTGGSLVVPAGCLDGTPNIQPQDNIFCLEKATWYDAGVSAKSFDKFPK